MSKKMHVVTLLVMVGMASGCSTGMVYPSRESIRIDVDGVIRRVEVKTPRTDLLVSGSDSKPQTSAPIPSTMEVPTPEPEITTEPEPTEKPERETRLPETVAPESEPKLPEPAIPSIDTNDSPEVLHQELKQTPVQVFSREPVNREVYQIIDRYLLDHGGARIILKAVSDDNLIAYTFWHHRSVIDQMMSEQTQEVRWIESPRVSKDGWIEWRGFLIPAYKGGSQGL
jgi:hypothetical protein